MRNLLFIFAVFATVLTSCDKPGDDQGCTSAPGSFCNTDSNPDAVYTPPVKKMTKGIIDETFVELLCNDTNTGILEYAINEEGHLVVIYSFAQEVEGINHPLYENVKVSIDGDPIYESDGFPYKGVSGVMLINTGVSINNGVLAKEVSIKYGSGVTVINSLDTQLSVDALKDAFDNYSATLQSGDCLSYTAMEAAVLNSEVGVVVDYFFPAYFAEGYGSFFSTINKNGEVVFLAGAEKSVNNNNADRRIEFTTMVGNDTIAQFESSEVFNAGEITFYAINTGISGEDFDLGKVYVNKGMFGTNDDDFYFDLDSTLLIPFTIFAEGTEEIGAALEAQTPFFPIINDIYDAYNNLNNTSVTLGRETPFFSIEN